MISETCNDMITGEKNEVWFREKYEQIACNAPADYALISFKMKRFNTINRVFGREAGDQILGMVFSALEGWLKPGEYAARMYADYFNLLAKFESIEEIHQRIIDLNEAVRSIPDERVHGKIFAGTGIFRLPEVPIDFYEAQYNADLCRKESLQSGYRNSHYEIYGYSYFNPNELYFDLEQKVLPAVENGEFKLYLQPKVDLKTGRIYSAEALMRWINPQKGMVPVGNILPGLEENGYIRTVDLYLFNQVCFYMDKWLHRYGKPVRISVNLSKAYFEDDGFVPEYTEVFERYSLPADLIEVELLESIVLDRKTRVQTVVQRLRQYGFACSLDDFGSGYSSFSVLVNNDLQALKIDRSLFSDEGNQREKSVLKNILKTAKDLRMQTVAEGVETEEYVRFLRQQGCDFVQGYVFYKPMPVEEFEKRFVLGDETVTL